MASTVFLHSVKLLDIFLITRVQNVLKFCLDNFLWDTLVLNIAFESKQPPLIVVFQVVHP